MRRKNSINRDTIPTLRKILEYIVQCQAIGVTPTRDEISARLYVPKITLVRCHLPRMVADGVLELPEKRRTIKVLRKDAYQ